MAFRGGGASSGVQPAADKAQKDTAHIPTLDVPAVTQPKGGGAIRGLGEKFSANPASGAASLTIPIAAPAGRNGLKPSLDLSYNTGGGNGAFGIGWQLAVAQISRRTDRGLPLYEDATDVFVLSGAEDLVPARRPRDDGGDEPDTEKFGDYLIKRYRPRVEGLFARIEQWVRQTDGDISWRVTTKENVTSVFGQDPQARICDPGDPSKVFAWLLQETRDDRGNAIQYGYQTENGRGVRSDVLSEATRFRPDDRGKPQFVATAQRYLKRILYGNRVPLDTTSGSRFVPLAAIDNRAWCFEVVLDYGDHDKTLPTPASDQIWPVRLDAFSTYRPTFEVRTYRLCRRVLVFHRFADLGSGATLVGSTDFEYEQTPLLSYLTSITRNGYIKKQGGGGYDQGSDGSLPPVEFSYTRATLHRERKTFPAESLAGLESGTSSEYVRWLDLNGEGIPGVLWSTDQGWYYKQNLGDLNLTAPRRLPNLPSAANLRGDMQLVDLDGEGELELVRFSSPGTGYWTRTDTEDWLPFVPISGVPHIDWDSPNLRLLDLDGDGLADVLITQDDALLWHRSRGRAGFEAAVRVVADSSSEKRPRLLFGDGTETIFLADMSGDGLIDVVRIRNSSVCYWPNLGRGAFGDRITLENAPAFDAPDQFDPRRIRLADIDGSGTTDVIYSRRNAIVIAFNQSGNSLSEVHLVDSLPAVDAASTVEVADLLGNGTACLFWSSPLLARRGQPIMLIDLMGGTKPHLLTSVVNNFGGEIYIEYTTSTRAYLKDKAIGRHWVTRLRFPVQVVSSVKHIDRVSDAEFCARYEYHHGYYDGVEREFRGFAFVETFDAEKFDRCTASELTTPPIHTKSWFHTGAWFDHERLESRLATEFWHGDGDRRLPEMRLPTGLPTDEAREAMRALRGMPLREEVYWEDGSALADRPYSVTDMTHEVRALQRKGSQAHGVFLAHNSERIQSLYERELADPRVSHDLTLEIDDYGNVCTSASIAYPRREPLEKEQDRLWCTVSQSSYVNEDRRSDWFRVGVPTTSTQWELCGLPHDRIVNADDVRTKFAAAKPVPFETLPDPEKEQKRIVRAECRQYWLDGLGGPAPFGTIGRRAILHQQFALALTPGIIVKAIGSDRVTDSMLTTECGYVNAANAGISRVMPDTPARSWWIPSGILIPDRARFYVPVEAVDAFGAQTRISYDEYCLTVVRTADALQNVTHAEIDYRLLNPKQITDPNGNVSLFTFNALGLVTSVILAGKNNEGDSAKDPTTRFEYELRRWITGQPAGASSVATIKPARVHVISRVKPGTSKSTHEEAYVYTDGFGREAMHKTLAEPGPVPVKYADGTIAKNPDATIRDEEVQRRWVGTGRVIYDNKGNPVKKYEPFFSATYEYEDEEELVKRGVTPTLHYDPLSRLVRTDNPDGTFSETKFFAWRQERWDENDTSDRATDWLEAFEAGTTEQQRVVELTRDHKGTPGVLHLDAMGRAFLSVADNGERGTYETRSTLDITGKILSVQDAKHRKVAQSAYDVAGRRLHEWLADSGDKWRLPDVADRPVRQWDARHFVQRFVYDELRRPTHLFVSNTSSAVAPFGEPDPDPQSPPPSPPGGLSRVLYRLRGTPPEPLPEPETEAVSEEAVLSNAAERLLERRYYGEDLQTQANATKFNLRTRVALIFDGAGMLRNDRFDYRGNIAQSVRRLAKQIRVDPDWAALGTADHVEVAEKAADALLGPTAFLTKTDYDNLNRPTTRITPDKSATHYVLNERGLLSRAAVQIGGASTETVMISAMTYNERGQRKLVEQGSGVSIAYDYDPKTFRLIKLLSTRKRNGRTEKLQDLRYTYDPVGNILAVEDRSDAAIYFTGTVEPGGGRYAYDALYQLIRATGREFPGTAPNEDDVAPGGIPHPNDLQKLQKYTETFVYDEVGNIQRLGHQADSGGWSRTYSYATDSNRLIETDTSGSPSAKYRYDEAGNMVEMPHLSEMRWDYGGRLRLADRRGGGKVWFAYDSSGQRVRKRYVHNGLIEERIYLDGVEYYTRTAANTGKLQLARETLHVMDGKSRVALIETKTADATITLFRPQTRQRFQLANHLGSSIVEVSEKAAVISFEEYHPFGSTSFHSARAGAEVSAKRYRYIGKERDEETGLYYHGARYYAAYLGRWTSCEPLLRELLAQTFAFDTRSRSAPSGYSSVQNNPIKMTDPDGLLALSTVGGIVWNAGAEFGSDMLRAAAAVLSHPIVAGGMQIAAGFGEATVAAGMLLAPEPVVTKVAGAVLFAHAADMAGAGLRTLINWQPQQTITSLAAEHIATGLGASPRAAHWIGVAADLAPISAAASVNTFSLASAGGRGTLVEAERAPLAAESKLSRPPPTEGEWNNMSPQAKGAWGEKEWDNILVSVKKHEILANQMEIELPSGKSWRIDTVSVSPEGVPYATEVKTGLSGPTPNQWEAFTKGVAGKWTEGPGLDRIREFASQNNMSLEQFTSSLRRSYVPMSAPH
ncbi:SpvB/TcaC N-terminal domain-containing protein [Bradyrhizobium sp. CCBAU 65884]|uniref:SpvB/TcaC N-terminal domain-containing protein n=1 Tax=Bradyrhizobium sp. CCBAU 65884 TaxID=722477 RepID=UPI002306A264|nr:SpvB/TcaC N-terminal domain-containing protein [Bradyrhizobium sp. CCBAU 65884]